MRKGENLCSNVFCLKWWLCTLSAHVSPWVLIVYKGVLGGLQEDAEQIYIQIPHHIINELQITAILGFVCVCVFMCICVEGLCTCIGMHAMAKRQPRELCLMYHPVRFSSFSFSFFRQNFFL